MSSNTLQILFNGLFSGSIYAVVAIGFFITYRSARFFDLSYPALLSVGAYMTCTCVRNLEAPIVISVVIGSVAAALCGALLELTVYRSLRKRGAPALVRLLASLGVMIIAFNLLSILFGDAALLAVRDAPTSYAVGEARFTLLRPLTLGVAIGLFLLSWVLIHRSRWGLQQNATLDDAELARCVGVDENVITIMGIALGAGVGSLAPALLAVDGSIKPTLGFDLALPALLATTAGGFRHLERPVLWALALGVLEQAFGWFVGVAWQEVLVACLFVLVLLGAPDRPLSEPQSRGST